MIIRTTSVAVCVSVMLCLGLAKPLHAQRIEIKVRLLDAHSGKPTGNTHVELFGTNAVQGLKAKEIEFDVNQQTGADGVARFMLSMPLPTRIVFWTAQAVGCFSSSSFATAEVVKVGVVSANTCPEKHEKFRWQDVRAEPGEIVIFTGKQRWAGW